MAMKIEATLPNNESRTPAGTILQRMLMVVAIISKKLDMQRTGNLT
jgi:hypothetical protein